jgi:hypothetical protein
MELHERRLFETTLGAAIERFRERIVQRNGGMERALERLVADPEGEGVWLGTFVKGFFTDELLDNPAGALYILSALERRTVAGVAGGKVGDVLVALAKTAFAELVRAKAIESLESGLAYAG